MAPQHINFYRKGKTITSKDINIDGRIFKQTTTVTKKQYLSLPMINGIKDSSTVIKVTGDNEYWYENTLEVPLQRTIREPQYTPKYKVKTTIPSEDAATRQRRILNVTPTPIPQPQPKRRTRITLRLGPRPEPKLKPEIKNEPQSPEFYAKGIERDPDEEEELYDNLPTIKVSPSLTTTVFPSYQGFNNNVLHTIPLVSRETHSPLPNVIELKREDGYEDEDNEGDDEEEEEEEE